jgi:hypothetical protein
MNVFISWSGERSRFVAQHLRDWLPMVIQAAKPWMSVNDIAAGMRWGVEVAGKLQDAKVGIICLTPENLHAPWLHFEAGALSKTLDDSFVCPYLVEVSPSEIVGPLAQFQAKNADKEGTRAVVQMINKAIGATLPSEVLNSTFDKWWLELEDQLKKIPAQQGPKDRLRKDRDILEEILIMVRSMNRPNRPVVVSPEAAHLRINTYPPEVRVGPAEPRAIADLRVSPATLSAEARTAD